MSGGGGQGALLIADSDIPTTHLVARELREALRPGSKVAPNFFGAVVTGRPVIVSRLCYPRYSWLPDHLSREDVRYAYFVDDNFWEITPDIDVRLARFFRHPATVETLDAFVRHAAVVPDLVAAAARLCRVSFFRNSCRVRGAGIRCRQGCRASAAAPAATEPIRLASASVIRPRRDRACRQSSFPWSSTFCAYTAGA